MSAREPGVLYILGGGPGCARMVTREAADAVRRSEAVLGWSQSLEGVRPLLDGKRVYRQRPDDYRETAERFLDREVRRGREAAVVRNGDPTLSSGLQDSLLRLQRRDEVRVRVIPGISSVQVAAARAGIALHRAVVFSFHDRDRRNDAEREFLVEAWQRGRHLVLLAGPEFAPADAALFLVEAGVSPDVPVMVAERLTWPEEQVLYATLGEVGDRSFDWMTVTVVPHPGSLPFGFEWPPCTAPPEGSRGEDRVSGRGGTG